MWLLYDYFLFHKDSLEGHDHYIEAYAKMYTEFLKWGITCSHFGDAAAADVIPVAKVFMQRTKDRINSILNQTYISKSLFVQKLKRFDLKYSQFNIIKTEISKLQSILPKDRLVNRRLVLAPTGIATQNILRWSDLSQIKIVGLADLSKSKQGRTFYEFPVFSYKTLKDIEFDILVITNMYFMNAILEDISKNLDLSKKEIILINSQEANKFI